MRGIWIVVSMIMLFQGSTQITPHHSDDLTLLLDATEEEGLTLEDWEIIFLEEMPLTSFEDMKNSLMIDHVVTKETSDGITKYIFQPKKKNDHLTYQFILLDSARFSGNVQIQLVLHGTSWDEQVKRIYTSMTNKLQRKYNLQLKENFTCIKVNDSDIINDGFSVNNMLEKMQILHKREQQDNITESSYLKNVYGYSPLLSNTIEIDTLNDKINLQLTIREKTNNKKQIIIGTPVILNEY